MKLEFLKNINKYNEHAVRLSDFNASEASLFMAAVERLIADAATPLELSSLPFIESVNCRLTLRSSEEDSGISYSGNLDFYCDLRLDSYREMVILLIPFCKKESKGYQWLYDLDNPIGFLFSAGKDIPVEE